MKLRTHLSALAIFAILAAVGSIILLSYIFNSYSEENAKIKKDISSEIETVIHSEPISSSAFDGPLDYLRPRLSVSNRLVYRVSSVELKDIHSNGEKGKISAVRHYEQYYLDGSTDLREDSFDLYIENIDGTWRIEDIHLPI